ncbi:hypothetical protein [Porphyromonas gulae]
MSRHFSGKHAPQFYRLRCVKFSEREEEGHELPRLR